MTSTLPTAYRPDRVSPPGDTLWENLDALGMSQTELSHRSGLAEKTISQIINGKAPITESTALALEKAIGVPAHFWLAREARFREFIARKDQESLYASLAGWARKFPYKKMADLGWLPPTSAAPEKAANLLSFFGVRDADCWLNVWSAPEAAFRQTSGPSKRLEVISAWLRRGEIEARDHLLPAYDEAGFKEVIAGLRPLAARVENGFEDEIRRRCAEVGVLYLLVPELPALGIYGVTRWLGDTPLIQQSLLLKSHDHFWFTFFHEARHVLQKKKKRIFLEGAQLDDEDREREADANRFSGDLLIPPADYRRFVGAGSFTRPAIQRFASSIGIHPGIVVGRLMREKHLTYGHPAQKLCVRLSWARP